MNQKGSIMK